MSASEGRAYMVRERQLPRLTWLRKTSTTQECAELFLYRFLLVVVASTCGSKIYEIETKFQHAD
jgi:hypothetical protein